MMLNVENINVYYGAIHALQGISFHLEEGEIVALIGGNGAGKSTTLNTISGLLRSRTGKIEFLGNDISQVQPQDIVKMSIIQVPEGRKIFSPMTVRENLEMGAFLRRDEEEKNRNLEGVFKHFPILKSRLKQMAGTMSGGEQQMLAMGRALMSNPKLLLLDEPSLGLSPIMCIEIAKIIRDIHSEGRTIVLVEQNARLALALAQKGYVLETGNIVLKGETKKLRDNEGVKKAYLGG